MVGFLKKIIYKSAECQPVEIPAGSITIDWDIQPPVVSKGDVPTAMLVSDGKNWLFEDLKPKSPFHGPSYEKMSRPEKLRYDVEVLAYPHGLLMIGFELWMHPDTQQYTFRFRCLHGEEIVYGVTNQAIEQCEQIVMVADSVVLGARQECKKHVTPPPHYYYPPFQLSSYVVGCPCPQCSGGIVVNGGAAITSHPTVAALIEIVPGLRDAHGKCPDCDLPKAHLAEVIIHLNDLHKWTRERIADWLDLLDDVDLTIQEKRTA